MRWGIDQFFKNKYRPMAYHSILRRKSINMLALACKKTLFLRRPAVRRTAVLEFLFNSRYCEIFKNTYFEEHLGTAASENVFMKLRKIKILRSFNCTLKNRFFQHYYQKQVKMFLLRDWFPVKFIFTYNISLV